MSFYFSRFITLKQVHVALFLLQQSKLHMMKFLDFMYENLELGSFEILYMDTDSFAFSLADEIDALVRPEKRDNYGKYKYDWFLKDDSAQEQRYPGKLKSEYRTTSGTFIGLSPKCYIFSDDPLKRQNEDKIACKGVSSNNNLTRDLYISSLYNINSAARGENSLFVFDRRRTCVNSIKQSKKLLNNFYTKFSVQSDLVTLRPLSKNNLLI